ncbi:MAG: hypothetical protein E7124_07645 [Bacteroidales bacterium]|nr:hypothetical protein [Bacteroidales bacterium]
MKQIDMDIFQDSPELKKMPFSVPESYFDIRKAELKKPQAKKMSIWGRISPYAAVAAVFIFMVSAGTFFLEQTTPAQDMTEEDYLLFSDNMTISAIYEMEEDGQIAEAGIADEDIIEYLIYSGITAEEIENSK